MMFRDTSVSTKRPTSNVIAMSRHKNYSHSSHIAEVEGYWHALRGRRAVPRRSEVDPRGIERALERTFILEQVAPGVGRLRIAGSHLTDLMGMEVRGMPLTALFSPTARDALSVCLDQLCRTPSTMILSLVSEQAMGKPKLTGRMLLLPLRSEDGAINRVLGCLDSNGLIGVAPRRFTIAACHTTTLEGDDLTERDAAAAPRYEPEPQATPQKAAMQGARFGFSESASPFTGQAVTGQSISGQTPNGQTPADATPASAFRHLRLVTSET